MVRLPSASEPRTLSSWAIGREDLWTLVERLRLQVEAETGLPTSLSVRVPGVDAAIRNQEDYEDTVTPQYWQRKVSAAFVSFWARSEDLKEEYSLYLDITLDSDNSISITATGGGEVKRHGLLQMAFELADEHSRDRFNARNYMIGLAVSTALPAVPILIGTQLLVEAIIDSKHDDWYGLGAEIALAIVLNFFLLPRYLRRGFRYIDSRTPAVEKLIDGRPPKYVELQERSKQWAQVCATVAGLVLAAIGLAVAL